MFLPYDINVLYELPNVYLLDGPTCRHRQAACGGVPENHMAAPMVIMIDAQATRNHQQILNPPIAGIAAQLSN
jgi:hypothetical protein